MIQVSVQTQLYYQSYGHFTLELNPDPLNPPKLDPKDQLLLVDPTSITSSYASTGGAGTSTPAPMPNVTWLRKTEYITREGINRSSSNVESYVAVIRYPCFLS